MGKGSKAKASSKSSKRKADKRKAGKGKGGASAKAGAPSPAKVTPDRKLSGKAAEKARKKRAEATRARKDKAVEPITWTDALRVGPGFNLGDLDPHSTPGFTGDKAEGKEVMGELQARLGDLQERLFAESKGGGRAFGAARHPGHGHLGQGRHHAARRRRRRPPGRARSPRSSRRAPRRSGTRSSGASATRCRSRARSACSTAATTRTCSIVRVHDLVPRSDVVAPLRPDQRLREAASSTAAPSIVKVMLHISGAEQKARLGERLEREDKHWKFNPGDIDERGRWADYMQAYQAALEKCSTEAAPWFVVPADRKWYARLAVTNLLLEALEEMDPKWPAADFDVEVEKERLALTP